MILTYKKMLHTSKARRAIKHRVTGKQAGAEAIKSPAVSMRPAAHSSLFSAEPPRTWFGWPRQVCKWEM